MNGCKLTSGEVAELVRASAEELDTLTTNVAVGILNGFKRGLDSETVGDVFATQLGVLYQTIALVLLERLCAIRGLDVHSSQADELFKEIIMAAGLSMQDLGENLGLCIDVKFS